MKKPNIDDLFAALKQIRAERAEMSKEESDYIWSHPEPCPWMRGMIASWEHAKQPGWLVRLNPKLLF